LYVVVKKKNPFKNVKEGGLKKYANKGISYKWFFFSYWVSYYIF